MLLLLLLWLLLDGRVWLVARLVLLNLGLLLLKESIRLFKKQRFEWNIDSSYVI